MIKYISCAECKVPLGEINKAKIRKNIAFLCEPCDRKRIAEKMQKQYGFKSNIDSMFNEIFGGKK